MPLVDEFSIQLYSVRDAMEGDFVGVLEKLAKMGYTGVEFAGYGGLSAAEMKRALDDNGLRPVGSHIGLKRMAEHLDEEIAFHHTLGTEYLICPFAEMKTAEDALRLAETLTPIISKIRGAGFNFAYHNHAHEFAQSGGEYLLDILFQRLPPDSAMELDIFWSAYAGVDSLAYMEKHRGRLKLLHVKQIDKDKHCVDLDQGILDFKDIIARAKAQGVSHFILEQEEYAVSSMASAKNDIDYIMSLEA